MRQLRPRAPSNFVWQGALILLPVVVLGVLGIALIRQDKVWVEQEARQRGEEFLGRVVAELNRELPESLMALARAAQARESSWMTNSGRTPVETASNSEGKSVLAASGVSRDTGLGFEFFLPTPINEAFEVIDPPPPRIPRPPAWLLSLTPEQMAAWQEATAADAQAVAVERRRALWLNFTRANPGQEARDYAAFAQQWLELEPGKEDSEPRLGRWVLQHNTLETESGTPVSAILLAKTLAKVEGLRDWQIDLLRAHLRRPCILTEALMNEATRKSMAGPAEIQRGVQAVAERWQQQQTLRHLVKRAGQTGFSFGSPNSSGWFSDGTNTFWALGRALAATARSDAEVAERGVTDSRTELWVLPYPVLVKSVQEALQVSQLRVPDYAWMTIVLEGQPILLPEAGDLKSPHLNSAVPQLASWSGKIGIPWPSRTADAKGFSAGGTNSPGDTVEAAFNCSIHLQLGKPDVLYQRQRQRQIWFLALILLGSGAAALGLIRARSAFYQERRLNELKSNFVSSVSHELRAPLASVRLMAESLERGKISDLGKQKDYFRAMVQECRRLTTLINNVLDFSRIEDGRKQYEFEPTNILQLVRDTVKLMENSAEAFGVQLELSEGAIAVDPELDGSAVQQALVNLIDNAMKHSPRGAKIRVAVQLKSSAVAIAVEDQGPGIPSSEHERIFERFYRLGSELRRETAGVGIGLSIVRHVVESHGGQVRLESEVGKGSRFTMELPLHPNGGRTL